MVDGRVRYGVKLPAFASVLAGFSADTRIHGLDTVPPDVRPTDRLVTTVHLSFDVMVAASFLLLGLSLWYAVAWRRRHDLPTGRWFLRSVATSGLVAVVALESGWIVTEVGRQPWTIVGVLLTRDAVTTSGNLWWSFGAVVAVYTAIGTSTVWVLRRMGAHWRGRERATIKAGDERGDGTTDATDVDIEVPYGPPAPRPVPSPKVTVR
jgi:cytochrome d ubiquinol oxidase subunit I